LKLDEQSDVFANRLWQRRLFDLRVRVSTGQSGSAQVVHGRTRDISFGGMGLHLTRELPEGTTAIISVRTTAVPKSYPQPESVHEFHLPAVLRHRKGFRCGFQFVRLTPEAKLFVQQLHRLLPA
jgi:hypothetical protein